MSGINHILLGAGPIYQGLLTPGFASGFYGYLTDLGGAGSLNPSGPSIRGKSIRRACSLPSTHDFTFWLAGTTGASQSLVSGLRVLDQSGVLRTYLTSAATYAVGGSDITWTWGTGSNPVWNSGVSGAKTFEVF